MRIGFDARPLQGETQFRGIGKSMEYLLTAISTGFPRKHDYVFYIDGALPKPAIITRFPYAHTVIVRPSKLGRRRYFRSFMAPFRTPSPSPKDVDVFFQYDAALGVPTSVPTVTIFHDVIPLLFKGKEPKQHVHGLRKAKNSLAGTMYWRKYIKVLQRYKHSARIIAISEASKRDYLAFVGGIAPTHIAVIPHGVSGFDTKDIPISNMVPQLASSEYLLYVGGIDLRKNISGLLQSFYDLKLAHPELKLVTVGKEFNLEPQLRDMGWFDVLDTNAKYAKDVIKPGYLSNEELAYLYQHAQAFVLASRYEGFGMPVLEAFQAGCPVVAYDNSSIPEVAGDAALLVPDGEPLAPAIEKLLNDKKLRDTLIKKGKSQAKLFTWDETARKTLKVLEEASLK